ncbi:MAG: helicase [Peptococcaceae bacterium BRH_c8a]|nr:MAG: helicase [Peptococcaceae bacterium BRH_c8a]
MFTITDGMIKELATNERVFNKGLAYYRSNRVTDIGPGEEDLSVSAVVVGSDDYEVDVGFSKTGEVIYMSCDCPAYFQYNGACKHIVALLKACQHRYKIVQAADKANGIDASLQPADEILDYFEYHLNTPSKRPINLEITLEIYHETRHYMRKPVSALSLRLGEKKPYVVKNVKHLVEVAHNGGIIEFGKQFTLDPDTHEFQPGDKPIISLLHELYEMEEQIKDPWSSRWSNGQEKLFKGKHVFLTPAAAKRLLSILHAHAHEFNLKLNEAEHKDVMIVEQDLPLHFTLGKSKDDLLLQWQKIKLFPLLEDGEYFFLEGKVYKLSDRQNKFFLPFLKALLQSPAGVSFSTHQKERLVGELLPILKQIGEVQIATEVKEILHEANLHVKVYLDKEDDAVTARVEFGYGEIQFNPFAGGPGLQAGGKILVRDAEGERAITNLFEKAEFRTLNGNLYLKEDEAVYQFVCHMLPEVQARAEVFYSESFRSMRTRSAAVLTGGVRLNEDNGMLEFSFDLEGIDVAELGGIFQSLREKKKYYRLKDGSFLPLDTPDSNLEQAMQMIDALDIAPRELAKKTLAIPGYRALYIDRCLRESNLRFDRNPAFKRLVQNINEPRDMEFTIPPSFNGVLRDYQKTGFKWLKTLAMYGMGGILADDMGLGKTIQAIAFILSEKERVPAPALVIAPTSVVYNWQEEARKFAPGMKVMVVSGLPGEREILLQEAQQADLVVTSYALIRRDVELYKDLEFGYCFLDEAQQIKNPHSLGAKAVKIIKARGYFALTGTPLENSLTELWSIFDFAMRGYLLTNQKFMKKYERPIVKDQNPMALRELQKQITPFILRRMKKDVLQELPPKIESKVLTDLTEDQKMVYLAYLQKAKGEIEATIAARGFEKSQIKILALLTRLRQICCHPATFLEDYQGDSGKLLYLREIMGDAIESGHRILLFSQFTSMLEIIRNYLDTEQIAYFYLDGATKMENRGKMVHAFNEGARDTFLISLKAGGTGLNLTGADMVIHYDPWWNPAVEEQATDRAYRIGQQHSVQVIKLITRGTIEEKIYALQQKKKAMIESVIQPGETMLTKMTEQEIRELFL